MLYCFIFVGIVALWMTIGSVVSLSAGTDPHEQFGFFMLEAICWPLVLYVVGWREWMLRITKWLSTRRVK